jgi:hypothetical protein
MENKSCNQRSLVSSRTKCFEIEFLRLGLMLSNNRLTSIHVTLPFSAHITIFITCFPGSIWTMLPTLSRICQDYWSWQFLISLHSSLLNVTCIHVHQSTHEHPLCRMQITIWNLFFETVPHSQQFLEETITMAKREILVHTISDWMK